MYNTFYQHFIQQPTLRTKTRQYLLLVSPVGAAHREALDDMQRLTQDNQLNSTHPPTHLHDVLQGRKLLLVNPVDAAHRAGVDGGLVVIFCVNPAWDNKSNTCHITQAR